MLIPDFAELRLRNTGLIGRRNNINYVVKIGVHSQSHYKLTLGGFLVGHEPARPWHYRLKQFTQHSIGFHVEYESWANYEEWRKRIPGYL